jgi:hypothetical protein
MDGRVVRPLKPKYQIKENRMSKMRSDCVFSKLTQEQVDTLEGWLFEENLSYKDALERAQKEFGIESSLTGLRRFYGRLAKERNQESLADTMSACVDAAAMGNDDVLRSGLLSMANVCAVQFLMESPKDVKTFTALLRALTSAQGQEMRRIKFEQEEGRHIRSRVMGAVLKRQEEERRRSQERDEENEVPETGKGAKAVEKPTSEADSRTNATSPRPSPPKAEREMEVVGSIPAPKNRVVSGNAAAKPSQAAVIVPLKAA